MTKEKFRALAKRALWTFLQAFLAVVIAKVPEGSSFSAIGWKDILEVAFVAGILSVCKSALVGVPEVNDDSQDNI